MMEHLRHLLPVWKKVVVIIHDSTRDDNLHPLLSNIAAGIRAALMKHDFLQFLFSKRNW